MKMSGSRAERKDCMGARAADRSVRAETRPPAHSTRLRRPQLRHRYSPWIGHMGESCMNLHQMAPSFEVAVRPAGFVSSNIIELSCLVSLSLHAGEVTGQLPEAD